MKREIIWGIIVALMVIVFSGIAIFAKHRIEANREKEKTSAVKDDFLKVPEYTTDLSEYTSSYSSTTDDNNSYWFVVVQDQNGSTMRNSFIKQEHPWFSYEEAKKEFKKDCFILNIVKVDKETYEHNNNK